MGDQPGTGAARRRRCIRKYTPREPSSPSENPARNSPFCAGTAEINDNGVFPEHSRSVVRPADAGNDEISHRDYGSNPSSSIRQMLPGFPCQPEGYRFADEKTEADDGDFFSF